MKRFVMLPVLAAAVALFGSSCYSDYGSVHTKRGAVVGGLLGAGAGALIGEHNDRELEGAAVGGVLGAITGGVLGSARDEEYYGRPQPRYRSYNPPPPPHYYRQPPPPYRSYSRGYESYHGGYYYRRAPSYYRGRGYDCR